jgi:hypothetical protein
MVRSLAALVLCSSVALSGCGGGVPVDANGDVVLPTGDGCGDAFFWAANAEDTVAVSISVEQRERSESEPTTASYDVGDAGLEVTVLRGDDLSDSFCTDLLVGDPVKSEEPASAGHVEIRLDPQTANLQGCGTTQGSATVTDLEGDGLSFGDFTVESASIGCYAG